VALAADIAKGRVAVSISCAECIHADVVAVGCSDGILRFWDCRHCATVKAIAMQPFHGGRGEICLIKVVPKKL
jgi:hypothetical protein